jgi:hypothetical protein
MFRLERERPSTLFASSRVTLASGRVYGSGMSVAFWTDPKVLSWPMYRNLWHVIAVEETPTSDMF